MMENPEPLEQPQLPPPPILDVPPDDDEDHSLDDYEPDMDEDGDVHELDFD